jgi:hypothetical protein
VSEAVSSLLEPAWAKQIGRNDCVSLLQQTLDEEKETDKKLTALAESGLHRRELIAGPSALDTWIEASYLGCAWTFGGHWLSRALVCHPIIGAGALGRSGIEADKLNVAFERLDGGKIRVGTSSWDDPKVLLPNQVLEVASIGKQFGLVRWTSQSLTWT